MKRKIKAKKEKARKAVDEASSTLRLTCNAWRKQPQSYEYPIIEHGGMLSGKPIGPFLVSTEGLHDEQVMKFVPFLREMHTFDFCRSTPPAQRFICVRNAKWCSVKRAKKRGN